MWAASTRLTKSYRKLLQGLAELQTKLANLILGLKAPSDMDVSGEVDTAVNGTGAGWGQPAGGWSNPAASAAGYASPVAGGWGGGGGTSPAQNSGGNTGTWNNATPTAAPGGGPSWGTTPAQNTNPWGASTSPSSGAAGGSGAWGAQQGWGSPNPQTNGWNL